MTKSAARGRELVEAWSDSANMIDLVDKCEYYKQQREKVFRVGFCDGGCKESNLYRRLDGQMVCFRTVEPCPKFSLRLIISHYATLGGSFMTNKSDTALIPAAQMQQIVALDDTISDCRNQIAEAKDRPAIQAFIQAKAMNALRKMITKEMMTDVMQLADTPIGFKTDRAPHSKTVKEGKLKPYSVERIKEICIVAFLRGFRICGNEFNIIAGNFYATKEGLERQVREFPGITDLKMQAGVPTTSDKGALVPYHASWKLNGYRDEIVCSKTDAEDTRLPIRQDYDMGIDAILGKAERRMYALILKRLVGSDVTGDEDRQEGVSEVIESHVAASDDDGNMYDTWQADFIADLSQCADTNQTRKLANHYKESLLLADEGRAWIDATKAKRDAEFHSQEVHA